MLYLGVLRTVPLALNDPSCQCMHVSAEAHRHVAPHVCLRHRSPALCPIAHCNPRVLCAMAKPAEFISDVDKYMQGQVFEDKILELQEALRSYRQREQQLLVRKARLRSRLPEIKMALESVLALLERKDSGDVVYADFELAEHIYAKAALQHAETVNIWLGANVMVEYPLEEAKQLLQQKLNECQQGLKEVEGDMHSIKDSTTITEVSTARVFNWDVERRRAQKLSAA